MIEKKIIYVKRKTEKEKQRKKLTPNNHNRTWITHKDLRVKKMNPHIKILIVEKDSINLVTVSKESKPSQCCDTILFLIFFEEIKRFMFNTFIDFILKFGASEF